MGASSRKEENHEPFPQCLLAELGLAPGWVAASQGPEQQASGAQTPAQKGEKPQVGGKNCRGQDEIR